jgi:hypothetical protein
LIRQELEHTSTIDLVRIVMLTEAGLRLGSDSPRTSTAP